MSGSTPNCSKNTHVSTAHQCIHGCENRPAKTLAPWGTNMTVQANNRAENNRTGFKTFLSAVKRALTKRLANNPE
jgi:hypothetical protein